MMVGKKNNATTISKKCASPGKRWLPKARQERTSDGAEKKNAVITVVLLGWLPSNTSKGGAGGASARRRAVFRPTTALW